MHEDVYDIEATWEHCSEMEQNLNATLSLYPARVRTRPLLFSPSRKEAARCLLECIHHHHYHHSLFSLFLVSRFRISDVVSIRMKRLASGTKRSSIESYVGVTLESEIGTRITK